MSDLTGRKFGKLTVLKIAEPNSTKIGKRSYRCICECGKLRQVTASNLVTGNTKSCGCSTLAATHRLSTTKTYKSWMAMLSRCYRVTHPAYGRYGEIGIVPCEYIRISPRHIVDIIGERPDGKFIDRINGLHGYTCGQCAECLEKGYSLNIRWATMIEQNRNRKCSRMVSIGDVTKCVTQWAEISGIHEETIRSRLNRGVCGYELLKTPKR